MLTRFRDPISGATRLAAVIGDPVRHSLSPAIHNAAFASLGLDWRFVALPVPAGQGAEAVMAMRVFGIEGLSVTMPHKQTVAEAVDRRTPAAEALGVCNCVFRRGTELIGDTTDGDGFVRSILGETTHRVSGASVIVVGAGGAARSIIEALGRAGAREIGIVNRTEQAARSASALAPQATTALEGDIADADIVINATSVGMTGGPRPGESPIDVDLLRAGQLVADIVYSPRATPLLDIARTRGLDTLDGLPMLVYQAVAQFELWTGRPAPLDEMMAAVDR